MLCDTTIILCGGSFQSNQDGNRVDVEHAKETAEVPCNTYLRAAVHHLVKSIIDATDRDGRVVVTAQATHLGRTHDVCDAVMGGDVVGQIRLRHLGSEVIAEVHNN